MLLWQYATTHVKFKLYIYVYVHVILSAVGIGVVAQLQCAIDNSDINPFYDICDNTYTLELTWRDSAPTCDTVQLVTSDQRHVGYKLMDETICEYVMYVRMYFHKSFWWQYTYIRTLLLYVYICSVMSGPFWILSWYS